MVVRQVGHCHCEAVVVFVKRRVYQCFFATGTYWADWYLMGEAGARFERYLKSGPGCASAQRHLRLAIFPRSHSRIDVWSAREAWAMRTRQAATVANGA